MGIKSEFEAHVVSQFQNNPTPYEKEVIRACMKEGAKWAMERCAVACENIEKTWMEIEDQPKCPIEAFDHPKVIRTLAKELEAEE